MKPNQKQFITMWDTLGFECIVDITSYERTKLLHVIKGEDSELKPPVSVSHMVINCFWLGFITNSWIWMQVARIEPPAGVFSPKRAISRDARHQRGILQRPECQRRFRQRRLFQRSPSLQRHHLRSLQCLRQLPVCECQSRQ